MELEVYIVLTRLLLPHGHQTENKLKVGTVLLFEFHRAPCSMSELNIEKYSDERQNLLNIQIKHLTSMD